MESTLLGVLFGGGAGLLTSLVAWYFKQRALDLEIEKLRREHLLHDAAAKVARGLLEHEDWGLRSFARIEGHLGGFKPDELRQTLVKCGAVRFYGTDEAKTELWGLLERNRHLVAKARPLEIEN